MSTKDFNMQEETSKSWICKGGQGALWKTKGIFDEKLKSQANSPQKKSLLNSF